MTGAFPSSDISTHSANGSLRRSSYISPDIGVTSTTLIPGNTLRYGSMSTRTVDRYGFVGGGQFSDPNIL
jgi:hypothetical protein